MVATWKVIALVFGKDKLPVRNISKEFRESSMYLLKFSIWSID